MADRPQGEFDTFTVSRHWVAMRPDGRMALLLETTQGRTVAFELPREILRKLAADLAKLSAIPEPPRTAE